MAYRRRRFSRRTGRKKTTKYRDMGPIKAQLNRLRPTTQWVKYLVPDYTMAKLRYAHSETYATTGAGVMGTNTYRGNSIYDPWTAGGGTSVQGYAQWAQFYNRYRVYGSKITVKARQISPTSTSNSVVFLVLAPKVTSTVDLDFEDAVLDPYARKAILPLPGGGGGTPLTLKQYISTRKILGLTKNEASQSTLAADITGNPSKIWYWHVGLQNADKSTTSSAEVYVEIEYYVKLYGKIDHDQ